MSANPHESPSIDRTVRDAAWLRTLAIAIVGDAHEADDLAQEAWVAFLRKRPDSGSSVVGWFRGVIRSLVRMRSREARSRAFHELAADETRTIDECDPALAVARLETQEKLLRAVRELAEPSSVTRAVARTRPIGRGRLTIGAEKRVSAREVFLSSAWSVADRRAEGRATAQVAAPHPCKEPNFPSAEEIMPSTKMIQVSVDQYISPGVVDIPPLWAEMFTFLDPRRDTVVQEISAQAEGGLLAAWGSVIPSVSADGAAATVRLFVQRSEREITLYGPSHVASPPFSDVMGAGLLVSQTGISGVSSTAGRSIDAHAYFEEL